MKKKIDWNNFGEGGTDDLLRETVEGFRIEPSPHLWKGIRRKLLWSELLRFNFTNVSLRYWFAGAAGLAAIAFLLFRIGSDPRDPDLLTVQVRQTSLEAPSADPAGTGDPTPAEPGNARAGSPAAHAVPAVGQGEGSVPAGVNAEPAPVVKPVSGRSAAPVPAGWTQPTPRPEKPAVMHADAFREAPDKGPATPVLAAVTPSQALQAVSGHYPSLGALIPLPPALPPDTIVSLNTPGGVFRIRHTAATRSFFSAGLGVAPELSMYSKPEKYSETNFWLNGRVTWHRSNVSVTTGAGLGYMFDRGKYRVEYNSFDSVGYYTGVTSFSVGPSNEIIYNTKTINLYDSIRHSADERTRNRYAYIQVPLLFGYRFFQSQTVSLTLSAGPAVAFLTGTRKSAPEIRYGNATLIRLDDQTPERVSANWMILGSLLCEIRLGREVSLYLDPTIKYALQPLVRKEGVTYKAPVTVGLGLGLGFNFGQKKEKP